MSQITSKYRIGSDSLTEKLSDEAGSRPGLAAPARGRRIRRSDANAGARPEPPVNMTRLQMRFVAAVKVAESTRSPNFVKAALANEIFDHLIFSHRLDGDEVHALFATKVSGVQPTDLVTLMKEGTNFNEIHEALYVQARLTLYRVSSEKK